MPADKNGAKAREGYGLRPLKTFTNRAAQLRVEILGKLSEGRRPWEKGLTISASQIVRETYLARSTVTGVMQQLVTEGVFSVRLGGGYTVLQKQPEERATTLVSVSEFCDEAGLECVSLLDPDTCTLRSFADVAKEVFDEARDQHRFRARAPALLNLGDDDKILFVRRIRGWRTKGSAERLRWAMLETLLLVPALVPGLAERFKSGLPKLSDGSDPLGNVALHRWMSSNNVELERSKYVLSVDSLSRKDRAAWNAVKPRPAYPAGNLFIRLRAVTYVKKKGPLLYTVENVVPGMLDLKVSGFQFAMPANDPFP